ncbi:hypothetical protein [Azotobacter vinelandii]|uniref:hypothetical protein n=1 Tax=Azotobacter vinelandii TaxID=354 RepID=UPI000774E34C|nr:hypothetical protein [Azotobacter vinelandii]
MSFDPFATLRAHWHDGTWVTRRLHNVRLLDVRPAGNGYTRLIVEHTGITRELTSATRWHDAYGQNRQNQMWPVGRHGYLEPLPAWLTAEDDRPEGTELPLQAIVFRAYRDRSLRRVPDLDAFAGPGHEGKSLIGWVCDAQPDGFLAPPGIIPGDDGQFVADEAIPITLRVPPEFVRECHQVRMTPQEVLRSFVGDLAGIEAGAAPRADHYSSNGSDERMLAQAWLDRAHGFNRIDQEELANREAEEAEREEMAYLHDDFVALLNEFERLGGLPEDLIAAVKVMLDKPARGKSQ